jgi:glycosyltransferase involved in cell wall biosynthesis
LKRTKKIILITGSYPPNHCGVGDYTSKLFECLKETEKFHVDLFYKSDWGLKYYFKYLRELFKAKSDVLHFQYPTEGYGYSMLPLMLFISLFRKNTVVTIHELSSRNRLAYVYTQLLVFFSKRVIVSNSLEEKHARRFVFKSEKVSVIPIASNIQKSNFAEIEFKEREIDLAYFGHIRPIKGIESFLYTISLFKRKLNVQLIGQVLEKYVNFFEEINVKADKLNVLMVVNKDENEVADILAKVKIVYLPFPDGISNRRGTLLAGIQNGCVVVSTKSTILEFNDFFEKYCYLVDTNEEAVVIIEKLLNGEIYPKEQTQIKYVFSWDNVISEHLKIYNNFD